MKRMITFASMVAWVLMMPGIMSAQIPNGGFEKWTNGVPDDWLPMLGAGTAVTKSTDAHSGSSAVRGEVFSLYGSTISPILLAGGSGVGTSCNVRAGSLTGYYKFVPAASSSDKFSVDIIMFTGAWTTGVMGSGVEEFGASTTSYKQFTVPISYIADGVPDSCYILITIESGDDSGDPTLGSYYIVDDLAFGPATGVVDNGGNKPFEFRLNQNYPNPFNPSTDISFSVPGNGRATLKVYNVMGQDVATLFNQTVAGGNNYHATFNGAGMASGVYFSRLQFIPSGPGSRIMQSISKMILTK